MPRLSYIVSSIALAATLAGPVHAEEHSTTAGNAQTLAKLVANSTETYEDLFHQSPGRADATDVWKLPEIFPERVTDTVNVDSWQVSIRAQDHNTSNPGFDVLSFSLRPYGTDQPDFLLTLTGDARTGKCTQLKLGNGLWGGPQREKPEGLYRVLGMDRLSAPHVGTPCDLMFESLTDGFLARYQRADNWSIAFGGAGELYLALETLK